MDSLTRIVYLKNILLYTCESMEDALEKGLVHSSWHGTVHYYSSEMWCRLVRELIKRDNNFSFSFSQPKNYNFSKKIIFSLRKEMDWIFRICVENKLLSNLWIEEKCIYDIIKNDNSELLRYLIKNGVNKESKNYDGHTALILASCYGKKECLKVLLELGANNQARDSYGNTGLLLASYRGHEECVKILLKSGVNKEEKNRDGDTALILSSNTGYIECMQLLLEAGANKEVINNFRCTALMAAQMAPQTSIKSKNQKECIDLLLQ